jgi:glucokinase
VEELKPEAEISGIGIATCGMVNDEGVIVGSAENISGWQDTPLKQLIQKGTGLPVTVENDANASAYGEFRAYNLNPHSSAVLITIGTGIGGGLIVNGKVVRGAHFAAGEVGHFKLTEGNRRKCSCGLWDCFEAYGAGRGLVTTASEILQDPQNSQSQLYAQRENLTTRLIIEAAANNDKAASTAMHIWHQHLSQGICTVAQTFDPECFILTGGLSACIDYPLLNKMTNELAVIGLAGNIKINPSLLGENPGLIGAAQLLLDELAVLQPS